MVDTAVISCYYLPMETNKQPNFISGQIEVATFHRLDRKLKESGFLPVSQMATYKRLGRRNGLL